MGRDFLYISLGLVPLGLDSFLSLEASVMVLWVTIVIAFALVLVDLVVWVLRQSFMSGGVGSPMSPKNLALRLYFLKVILQSLETVGSCLISVAVSSSSEPVLNTQHTVKPFCPSCSIKYFKIFCTLRRKFQVLVFNSLLSPTDLIFRVLPERSAVDILSSQSHKRLLSSSGCLNRPH